MEQSNLDIDPMSMNFFFNERTNINQQETKRVSPDALQVAKIEACLKALMN